MLAPRTPIYLSHAPVPKVQHFAILAALEAGIRGLLLSVMPLAVYQALGDARLVSALYFSMGIVSLVCGLMVPALTRILPRRWTMTLAGGLYLLGMAMAASGTALGLSAALFTNAIATVTFTICLNAYVLDYIERTELGRNESLRMVYSAACWSIGPLAGVALFGWWKPAPFLLAALFALALIAVFWLLRLGNGKQIARARGPAPNPLAYLGRFLSQPRLIAGWLFAVLRSCGWWVYAVYLPIFCVQNGLGDKAGAVAMSTSNALLFVTPFMLRIVRRISVRRAVVGSFTLAAMGFIAATVLSPWPWASYGSLMASSSLLIMLDVCGGLPFLMAVRPAERTEMAAVYASFRDVSGILTPGVAALVLLFAPVSGVFAAAGVGMAIAAAIGTRLHPRLGAPRPVQRTVTME